MNVLSVIGTRPEAIKMAPLILQMESQPERFTSVVCTTGQHREMLTQALDTFGIHVHHALDLMTENQPLDRLTARVLTEVTRILVEVSPELVLVQGDTTTALAAALAAYYQGIRIAHIEAGLRTGDMRHPFPEEANRVLVDRLASLCFAPTLHNRQNLLREGIGPERIFVTGNTGIDALLMLHEKVKDADPDRWRQQWGSAHAAIADRSRPLILLTAHRRENFGQGVETIYRAVRALATRHAGWHFVYPVHLNPNIQKSAKRLLSKRPNITLIDPLDYEPFVYLMTRAHLILTDSGGIQEEAPSLGTPVIVLRDKTERMEALQAGTVVLAGTNHRAIEDAVETLMQAPDVYRDMSRRPNPYGDGLATQRILDIVWKQCRPSS